MKRYWIIGAVIALLGVTCYLLYDRADSALAASDYSNWAPNAEAIRQALGKSNGSAADDKERLEKFCKLFQSRFRDHDPMMAIGMHRLTQNRLKLMCPARMEPVDIDCIALIAWHEAQDTFDHPFEVDLYATFIGTPPIKIGELRAKPDNPKIARVVYRYPATIRMPLFQNNPVTNGSQSGKGVPPGIPRRPLFGGAATIPR